MGAMTLVSVAVGFLLAIASSEALGAARFLSRRILHIAVRRLPDTRRDDLRDEWLGEWDAWDGANVGRLVWSCGLLIAAARLARPDAVTADTGDGPPLRGWRRLRQGDRDVFVWLRTLHEVNWGGISTLLFPFEGRLYYVSRDALQNRRSTEPLQLTEVEWDAPTRLYVDLSRNGNEVTVTVRATLLDNVPVKRTRRSVRARGFLLIPGRVVDRGESNVLLRVVRASGVTVAFRRVDPSTGEVVLEGMATTNAMGEASIRVECARSTWLVHDVNAPAHRERRDRRVEVVVEDPLIAD